MVETTSLKSGINLIPTSTSSPQPVRKAMYYGLMASRYAVLGIGVLVLGLLGYKYYLTSQLVSMKQGVQTDLAYIESKDTFQNSFEEFQTYSHVLGATHSALSPTAMLFSKLEELTPKVVRLFSFNVGKENVRINATTNEYPAVSDYVDNLSKADFVKSVEIVSLSRSIDSGVDNGIVFTLEIKLK